MVISICQRQEQTFGVAGFEWGHDSNEHGYLWCLDDYAAIKFIFSDECCRIYKQNNEIKQRVYNHLESYIKDESVASSLR